MLGPLGCSVVTYRHSDVRSSPLSQLCLPIDVNGLHRFQHYFLDRLIVKETGDVSWPHQDFKLMPLSIIESLREGTEQKTISHIKIHLSMRLKHLCFSFESWVKLNLKAIINLSNLLLLPSISVASLMCSFKQNVVRKAKNVCSLNAYNQKGIKTQNSFLFPPQSFSWKLNPYRGRVRNRAAIVSLGLSHSHPFQVTNHRLLPFATSNQIKSNMCKHKLNIITTLLRALL